MSRKLPKAQEEGNAIVIIKTEEKKAQRKPSLSKFPDLIKLESPGLIPGSGRCPGEGNGNPFQYSCLENPHGQRTVAGYSPWCCKGSDITEQLTLSLLLGLRINSF